MVLAAVLGFRESVCERCDRARERAACACLGFDVLNRECSTLGDERVELALDAQKLSPCRFARLDCFALYSPPVASANLDRSPFAASRKAPTKQNTKERQTGSTEAPKARTRSASSRLRSRADRTRPS